MKDRPLRASYRLQLHRGFDFARATELLPYLEELGISHLYLSPIFQAAQGSLHGYDVVDCNRINQELGGEAGFIRLSDEARKHGMSIIVDIVPNHMYAGAADNVWWWDVLENGPSSYYASYFDIDWHPPETKNRNVVLLPVLDEHRGKVLAQGRIALVREGARFTIEFGSHRAPASPESIGWIFTHASRRLAQDSDMRDRDLFTYLADSLRELPRAGAEENLARARRQRDKEILFALAERLLGECANIRAAVDAEVAALCASADRFDEFLNAQNHRLVYWKTGRRELDYRRFFDLSHFVGLRQEDPEVFAAVHQRIVALVNDGRIQGLRVDHIDGLADPAAYLQRLRALCPDAWILVEKITSWNEDLPSVWACDGTTGYEFMNAVQRPFSSADGVETLVRLHDELTGEKRDFTQTRYESCKHVLADTLAADVERVTQSLALACSQDMRYADLTRDDLRHALVMTLARFPRYRTYVRAQSGVVDLSETDRAVVHKATSDARKGAPEIDALAFEALEYFWMGGDGLSPSQLFVRRVQQLSAASVARGVEDTAFYRDVSLLAWNEVGGDPAIVECGVAGFHSRNRARAERRSKHLNASSTHDTKRSEDVRARLGMLDEHASEWTRLVRELRAEAEAHRRGGAPDPNLELLFFQSFVGAWPWSYKRAVEYMRKAAREAKTESSWTSPNEEFERGLESYLKACFDDQALCAKIGAWVSKHELAARVTSLSQCVLKLMSPGVPDFYQGTEVFSYDLVDPDNRNAVDYEARRRTLRRLKSISANEVWRYAEEGAPKLFAIQRALELRKRHPALFDENASYDALYPTGNGVEHVIAFTRATSIAVVVPCRVSKYLGDGDLSSLAHAMHDTKLVLPAGEFVDIYSGRKFEGTVSVAALWQHFPVAVLERTEPLRGSQGFL